jgi:hypothetical protein
MIRYSLVLLAAAAVFSGCSSSECCEKGIAPIAVIAGLGAGQTLVADSFTLGDGGSSDSDGTVSSRTWTVGGVEVENGYTLPVGTHDVCLLVTDNDGLTNKTCGKVTINEVANVAPTAVVTAPDGVTCDAGVELTLNGNGTDTDGTVAVSTYVWNPNTNITGSGASVTYTCPASGSQEVCLTVTDNDGASSVETVASCKTITVNTVTPVTFGLRAFGTGTPPDGYNIRCSSDGTTDNILFGTANDIKEIYWEVNYHGAGTSSWFQTVWNSTYDEAAHFCGKWVGGNGWTLGNPIDINATVLNNSDVNTTYQFTIGADGNITANN